jgi:hypothetical protein
VERLVKEGRQELSIGSPVTAAGYILVTARNGVDVFSFDP